MTTNNQPSDGAAPDSFRQSGFSVCQVAVSTGDMVGSLRLFDNCFGFVNAGGSALWGKAMRVTGLDADARALVWWLVGHRPFFQLEFFEYTNPTPASAVHDSLGWSRIGITVPDLSRVSTALADFGLSPTAVVDRPGGTASVSFREPFAGFVIDAIEVASSSGPEVVYATQTVLDLAAATRLHATVLGAMIQPLEALPVHIGGTPQPGVPPGQPGFLAIYGDFIIQVLGCGPAETTAAPQRRVYDHGLINLALGSRDFSTAADLIERLRADGHQFTELIQNGQIVGTYFVDPGCEFEIFSLPAEFDAILGFCAGPPFVASMGF